jgi:hypothetical protein
MILLSQMEKFQKAEDLTEEAKRAAREAHLKAEEALRKQAESQAFNERAAKDRGKQRTDAERLQEIKKLVRASCALWSQNAIATALAHLVGPSMLQ